MSAPKSIYIDKEMNDNSNLSFIEDCKPKISPKGYKYRRAVFECGLCGNKKEMTVSNVKSGRSKTCGCAEYKHGMVGHTIHNTWHGIKDRCFNKATSAYPRYGGRGISVDENWAGSFEEFHKWCLDNGWENGLEIDRIDNNGNYEPDNCRFVTRSINCRNTRRSKWWFIDGRKFDSCVAASKFYGVDHQTIINWCDNNHMKKDCWSELKYPNNGAE